MKDKPCEKSKWHRKPGRFPNRNAYRQRTYEDLLQYAELPSCRCKLSGFILLEILWKKQLRVAEPADQDLQPLD